jgi:hypothetical protein
MKLFSRKALVAGAAAVALSFAGTSVATAEETNTGGSSISDIVGGSSSSDSKNDTNNDADSTEDNGNGDGDGEKKPKKKDGSSDMNPEEIDAWVSVFGTVIGTLGALFAFASKYLGFKL